MIDADVIAREVVQPGTPGLAAVTAAFGPEVIRPDGRLDRDKLGGIVFADPALLARLNSIIHPLVRERMAGLERLAAAEPAGAPVIVVHDVPLLAENGLAGQYDVVVVVDAPPRTQIERLTRGRDMTREQAQARMAAMASVSRLDRVRSRSWGGAVGGCSLVIRPQN